MDVKETKELVGLVCTAVDSLDNALEDGKIDLMDLPKLMPVLVAAPEALAGLDKVWPELKDLSQEEIGELAEMAIPCVMQMAAVLGKLFAKKEG